MYILRLPGLSFYGIPVCANVCVSAPVCVCSFFAFSCLVVSSYSKYCLLLTYPVAFYHYWFSNDRQKSVDLDGREGGKKMGGMWGELWWFE